MQPDSQVVFVLAVLYAIIVIVIVILGLYIKNWEEGKRRKEIQVG